MEKLVPQNIEAEQGVLGSIIIDPESYDLISDTLTAADFYRDAHQLIYESIVRLRTTGNPADYLTVCDDLEVREKIDEVGGAAWIASMRIAANSLVCHRVSMISM